MRKQDNFCAKTDQATIKSITYRPIDSETKRPLVVSEDTRPYYRLGHYLGLLASHLCCELREVLSLESILVALSEARLCARFETIGGWIVDTLGSHTASGSDKFAEDCEDVLLNLVEHACREADRIDRRLQSEGAGPQELPNFATDLEYLRWLKQNR